MVSEAARRICAQEVHKEGIRFSLMFLFRFTLSLLMSYDARSTDKNHIAGLNDGLVQQKRVLVFVFIRRWTTVEVCTNPRLLCSYLTFLEMFLPFCLADFMESSQRNIAERLTNVERRDMARILP